MNTHQELLAHYADVRKRLTTPPVTIKRIERPRTTRWLGVQHAHHVWDFRIEAYRKVACAAIVTPSGTIVREVCKKYGVTPDDIKSVSRRHVLILPRQELCYRLRTELGWQLTRIAVFVERDHTTVFNSIRRHEARISQAEGQAND